MQLARGPWIQDTFVFIEVFGCEGGIQSYIKDVLTAYSNLDTVGTATIFLLRDSLDDIPPEFMSCFNFKCFQSGHPMVDRIRFTLSLAVHLFLKRPRHLFCGHINLAVMARHLTRLANVPYTVLTYGKEVWFPLKPA
ncbi:MAG: glycosyl transferase group 1, partial [Leptolyngbya sp. SIO3F4]|nr:glycosyl transferase group 1 [Leptolyngbya sp. SIO3F4]